MTYDEIYALVGDVPIITADRSRQLYDFVLEAGPREILELGFAHGASTAFMAAALHERGEGHILTMDLDKAAQRNPSIDEVLARAGLAEWVTPVFSKLGYNWEMGRLIQERSSSGRGCEPRFDFAFVDGAHTWDVDGFAFFLVDKLLRPGGWILWDDLNWSLSKSASLRADDEARSLPQDYLDARHVADVVALLVAQHPSYDPPRIESDWAWCHKVGAETGAGLSAEVLDSIYHTSIQHDAAVLARRVWRAARSRVKARR